jgi:hypothetical protein
MNTFTLKNITCLTQRRLSDGGCEIAFESSNTGMCHQLYVDSSLRDWTEDPLGRRFLVPRQSQGQTTVIAAVAPEDRAVDFSALLPREAESTCVFRMSVLPPAGADSGRLVLLDDHASQSPQSAIASVDCRRAWQGRLGLGQDRFGFGGLGYDDSGAAGLGRGGFALGQFGFDAMVVQLQAFLKEEGLHRLTMGVIRDDGQEAYFPSWTVLVLPPPPPVQAVQPVHYDPQNCTLTLHIE